jgi:4-amino-4-deoxy-L-arabinose transferase-like glycosyltransferase
VAVIVPFLGRYGWDRDELYFLSAAKRPALGYVDFPPLVAWLGLLVRALFGDSLDALRLSCLALMVVADVLVVLMARELGGRWRAQLLAGGVWAFSPYALGAGSIFHPTGSTCSAGSPSCTSSCGR